MARRMKGEPNPYGPDWANLSLAIKQRDGFRCRGCDWPASRNMRCLVTHHRVPLQEFTNFTKANHPSNLVALCGSCHRQAHLAYNERGEVLF